MIPETELETLRAANRCDSMAVFCVLNNICNCVFRDAVVALESEEAAAVEKEGETEVRKAQHVGACIAVNVMVLGRFGWPWFGRHSC